MQDMFIISLNCFWITKERFSKDSFVIVANIFGLFQPFQNGYLQVCELQLTQRVYSLLHEIAKIFL